MPTATVVGAGVIGLTSAVRLAEAGFAVRVVSREPPATTTSAVAAAVWFPFAAAPEDRVDAWSMRTYEVFAQQIETGAHADCLRFTTARTVLRGDAVLPAWHRSVRGFAPLPQADLPPGARRGFAFDAPVADMPDYLHALEAWLAAAGIRIERQTLDTLDSVSADVVVHATGLGAREVVDDRQMTPLWGQVLHVARDADPGVWIDDDHPEGMVYVVQRGHDIVVGGIAMPGREGTIPDRDLARTILRRATTAVPALQHAEVLRHRAAARPCRTAVRLELEHRSRSCPVVHCYGHGGSGMTMSWGCAEEVTTLALTAVGRGGEGCIPSMRT